MAIEKSTQYMDGWNAHKEGHASKLNPYPETLCAFSHRHWLSGWCDRFDAVKHGHSTDLDHRYE